MATQKNRKGKSGFRPDANITMRNDIEPAVNRKNRTPLQHAKEDMAKSLDLFLKVTEVSDELKRQFIGELDQIDTAVFMNMKTLAATMLYLSKYGEDPSNFTDENLKPYIDTLMINYVTPGSKDTPSIEEQNDVRYRYKQTILRYLAKVFASRQENPSTISIGGEPIYNIEPEVESEEE